MPDPLQRAVPLTPLRLSASAWNRMLDAAKATESGARNPATGGLPNLVVSVRNDTGGDLAAFAVVRLGDSVLDVTTPLRVAPTPTFEGLTPAGPTDAFAVLLEPAKADKFALAVVSGVVPCGVNVTSASHDFAAPGATTERLTSAASGPARILAKSAATGEVDAVVLLGVGGGSDGVVVRKNSLGSDFGPRPRLNLIEGAGVSLTVADDSGDDEVDVTVAVNTPYIIKGKLDGSLTFGSSATMSVWAWNGSAEADTGADYTVYDWVLSASGEFLGAGTKVIATLDSQSAGTPRYYVTAAQC